MKSTPFGGAAMVIQIRPAVPGEVDRLSAIARSAKAHWGYPAEWLAQWAGALTITAELIQRQPTFVAAKGEAIIGFYGLEDLGERWSLAYLWVVPEHHRAGVGRRLLTHALETVRAIRPGVLEIESDPHAAPFYERCGARRVGAVPAPMPGAPSRALPLLEIAAPADEPVKEGASRSIAS
jgi:GNAT superfamily N-acetyltransferase